MILSSIAKGNGDQRIPMPSSRLIFNETARSLLSPVTAGRASDFIKPTIAAIYITKHCNSRCTMCDFWKNEKDPLELSSEQWGIIFSKLKVFGVDFIGVNASGEMFTRKDVFTLLEHIRNLDMDFGVNSNGTLFTPDKAKRLAELKPRAVTLGLDGVGDEAYLATRGLKGGFTKISRHIDNLKLAGIHNIGIGSVLMTQNMSDWVNLAHFALEKELSGIRYTAHHDAYFTADETQKQSPASFSDPSQSVAAHKEIDRLIQLKRETGIVKNSEMYLRKVIDFYQYPGTYFPAPCIQGSNRIEIDVNGNVTLCSFVTEPLGNLLHQEMNEIWSSSVHQEARHAAHSGHCPKCFLSCYAEENLRLSAQGFLPTLKNSIQRGRQLLLKGRN